MSWPTPLLDDRRFQDIVDDAKRLIPRYCPEWTDHNLSDPGVALIELFAWMTEMTLYRVNQVPEKHYLKFLELMGIQRFPGAAACTEIAFWLSTPQPETVVVPERTQVGTIRTEQQESIVFTTDEPLSIVVPVLTGCLTSADGHEFEDHWDDLRAPGITVDCFPSVRPGDMVCFAFAHGLASNILRLDFQCKLEGRGVDPIHPPWAWEVWGGEGWLPARVHQDQTEGFNRDGSLTLICPRRHESLTLGPSRGCWIRCRMTGAVEGQPTYQKSPTVMSLKVSSLGGLALAHHGDLVEGEWLGRSDGSPGQRFAVSRCPDLPRGDGETVVLKTADGAEEWQEVVDFSASGPSQRHFAWDSATGEISFGPRVRMADGDVRQHGAIPPPDAQVSVSRYRYGGGTVGNVGAKTLSVLKSSIPFIGRVENLETARGGVDPETVENAKVRGPLSLRTGQRAVTCSDFERLTMEASSMVARVRCLPPETKDDPVRILIVPRSEVSPQDLAIDDLDIAADLVEQISACLDERRILSVIVTIGPPYYQGVSVAAKATASPGVQPGIARERALTRLYEYINPLTGGPDGSGWPFGRDLSVGEVFALLSTVDGISSVQEVELCLADTVTTELEPAEQFLRLPPDTLWVSYDHKVVVS